MSRVNVSILNKFKGIVLFYNILYNKIDKRSSTQEGSTTAKYRVRKPVNHKVAINCIQFNMRYNTFMNSATKLIAIIILLGIGIGLFFVLTNRITPENTKIIEESVQEDSLIPQDSLTSTTMKITSSAFENDSSIPSKYTCDGENINPPLSISDIPADTKSMVLISDDPDAPAGTWIHWTAWNIPPNTTEIAENSSPPGIQGTTSFNEVGYGGPCPPSGTHRYFFKIYALDTELNLGSEATSKEIEAAMQNHILDSSELIGLYSRE